MIGSHNFYTRKSQFSRFLAVLLDFHIFIIFLTIPTHSEHFPSTREASRSLSHAHRTFPIIFIIFSDFFLIFCYYSRFSANLSDSLRVFPSFTYCEYTRASPNTLFPIIADHRRVSLILLYFMSGYLVFLLGHPLCYPHTSATLPL